MHIGSYDRGSFVYLKPHLCVRGVMEAMAFYQQAFGARMIEPPKELGGRITSVDVAIGEVPIELFEESLEEHDLSPQTVGGSPVALRIYVEDEYTAFRRAIEAGARVLVPQDDGYHFPLSGRLVDPFGHHWLISCIP